MKSQTENKTLLFSPLKLRELEFKNRVFVSPMCQYSAIEGTAQPWHLVHLGTRASGGAGLVMAEATGVSPEARISPQDLGLWTREHAQALKPVTDFIHSQNSVSAVQLAHAGRKAGTAAPWNGAKPVPLNQGGWIPVGPSPIPYNEGYQTPKEMDATDINKVLVDFENSTRLAQEAGFQVVEVHMAHGYLLHEFLSPLSNQRKDQYGGSLENRMRFPLQVAERVRKTWPQHLPVFARISASDWAEGGWDIEQSIVLSRALKNLGIDLIDCSSGGNVPWQKIPVVPEYQVPFAEKIKAQVDITVGAVGLITEAQQAENILQSQKADVIFLARELLRNPYWPLKAAHDLGEPLVWPRQYDRGKF